MFTIEWEKYAKNTLDKLDGLTIRRILKKVNILEEGPFLKMLKD
ncbi:MAG: type II toxin-antitoxin system RelE/ParE family toxin [Candidatus Nanoarchaeia archaeon]